jgi:uncharacterized protein (DUF362 family)
VAVVGAGEGVAGAVDRAVALIGGLNLEGDEHAIIKPNICNAKNPDGMVITDFRLIEAVINLLKGETRKITVVESDNISDTAENRIAGSGLQDLLEGLEVDFVNLSRDDHDVHEVAGRKLRLPRTVLEADYFINLPKIKTEGHVSVTLSIKNLFGILGRRKKSGLHVQLDEILPYLAGVVGHDLIVVDGLTCMEGNGPLIGTPKELGIVVAGVNPVSVDAVCSRIMGLDPADIAHIASAHGRGLGEMDVDAIEVVGDGWERYACDFERPYSLMASLKSLRSIKKVYLPG